MYSRTLVAECFFLILCSRTLIGKPFFVYSRTLITEVAFDTVFSTCISPGVQETGLHPCSRWDVYGAFERRSPS